MSVCGAIWGGCALPLTALCADVTSGVWQAPGMGRRDTRDPCGTESVHHQMDPPSQTAGSQRGGEHCAMRAEDHGTVRVSDISLRQL